MRQKAHFTNTCWASQSFSLQSQLDGSISSQNELAMHNMQCMNLCQEQCVNGQLPSDIYQFDGQNSNTHTLPAQITTAMQQPIQVRGKL